MKVDEREGARLIAKSYPARPFAPAGRDMINGRRNRGSFCRFQVANDGSPPPVDPVRGEMEEQIKTCFAPDEAREDRPHFGAYTRKAVDVRVKGIEDRISHQVKCAAITGFGKRQFSGPGLSGGRMETYHSSCLQS